MTDDLVTTEWLLDHINDSNLRIVDCRWVLGEPGQGKAQYEAGHISGAVHLDVEEHLSGEKALIGKKDPEGREGPGRHPLPGRFNFQKLMSSIGIGRETRVVAYDGGRGMPAPRLWWLLRFYGHESVSVLDGGWEAWMKSGGPVQTEVVLPREVEFMARPKRKWVVDKEGVDSVRDEASTLLIDARAPERYRGESEPIDAKAGHIPGAENFPFTQAIDPATGKFRSAEQLKKDFEAIGVDKKRDIICYCGSGITACTNILALKIAGFEAQLYEGSWSDWSADDNLQVAVKKFV